MRSVARTLCLACAIVIAALAADVPSAAAQALPCQDGGGVGGVVVHVLVESRITWCSTDVIRANSDIPAGTTYALRPAVNGKNAVRVSGAISINRLLTLARVPPQAVTFTYVDRSDGGQARLSDADVSSAPPFLGGLKPVVWLNGGGTSYLRPLRSAGDENAPDYITDQFGALDLYVSSGRLLDVTASANLTSVGVGKPVRLTARVTNAIGSDGPLSYSWDFQDGTTATGPSVVHMFHAAGPYYPIVHVVAGGDGAAGISPPVLVTVGSVSSSGVSLGKYGGVKPIKPIHFGSFGTKTGAPGSAAAGTGHGGGGSGSGTGAGTGGSSGSGSSQTAGTARSPAAARQRVKPAPTRGGTSVDGLLIAGVVPVSPAEIARSSGDGTQSGGPAGAATVSAADGGVTPLGGAAGGLAVVLLLASGTGIELRSRRRAARIAPVA